MRHLLSNGPILYSAFFILLLLPEIMSAEESEFVPTLPVYYLTLSSEDLCYLEENPGTDEEFPAILECDNQRYEAAVRFRGRATRRLPKHSWNIDFAGHGPLGWESTNLKAEYRDRSLIRDQLATIMGTKLRMDVPIDRFVSLYVNGEYSGVYYEVEDIKMDFFERRGIPDPSLLLQGRNQCGRFMPLMHEESLLDCYKVKKDKDRAFEKFNRDCMFFQYADPDQFRSGANQRIDIQNVLTYFALQVAINNVDGFIVNYYVARMSNNLLKMYPWDCDGSFGNFNNGVWLPTFSTDINFQFLAYNVLFSRLMETDIYYQYFVDLLRDIGSDLMPSLAVDVDSLYQLIEHDRAAETVVSCTYDEFLAERDSLHVYLQRKSEVLATGELLYEKAPFRNVVPTHSTITPGRSTIRFEMKDVFDISAVKLNLFHIVDDTTNREYFFLNDNGENGDQIPGDGCFSLDIDLGDYPLPVYYLSEARKGENIYYYDPPGGRYHYQYHLGSMPSIRNIELAPEPGDIIVSDCWDEGLAGTCLVILRNGSDRTIELNGSTLCVDQSYLRLILEDIPLLSPDDEITIAGHVRYVLDDRGHTLAPNSFFGLTVDADSLFLFDTSGKEITSAALHFEEPVEQVGKVVVNEINYHSSDSHNTGDWIELFIREGPVDLSGWLLRDNDSDHQWEFPTNAPYSSNHYIVVAEEPERFQLITGYQGTLVGGFDFSLSNGGDQIQIWDNEGRLIDFVSYTDSSPWPTSPDGRGPTLELLHPDSTNQGCEYWLASLAKAPHGTPGKRNSVHPDSSIIAPPDPLPPHIPEKWEICELSPNPFNSQLKIVITAPESGNVAIDVYNILGRRLGTIRYRLASAGITSIFWNGSFNGTPAASGVYFLAMREPVKLPTIKVVYLQ